MPQATIKNSIQNKTFKEHCLSGNKQDNLYLPIVLITSKKVKEKLQLKNNTSVTTSKKKNIIAFFGDSFTENVAVDPIFEFSNILKKKIKRLYSTYIL